jgi:hypothetical protein
MSNKITRGEALKQVQLANAAGEPGVEVWAYRDHGRWLFGFNLATGAPKAVAAESAADALRAARQLKRDELHSHQSCDACGTPSMIVDSDTPQGLYCNRCGKYCDGCAQVSR